jgi:hypothetical protein
VFVTLSRQYWTGGRLQIAGLLSSQGSCGKWVIAGIVTTVVKAPGFGHLLVELSAREDLREFAETASSNEELFSLLAAMAADASILKIVCAIISAPGLAGLLLEIIQQSDLRALTK